MKPEYDEVPHGAAYMLVQVTEDHTLILGIVSGKCDAIDDAYEDDGPDVGQWDNPAGTALVDALRADTPDWGLYIVRVEPTEYLHRSGSAARGYFEYDIRCRRPLSSEVAHVVAGRPFVCRASERDDASWLPDTRQPTTTDIDDV